MWAIKERCLSAHGQLYSPGGNKFSNVTTTASNNLFDAKDQMIHSAIVHENLLLSNNNTNSGAINLLPLHAVITLCLHSVRHYTQLGTER